MKKTAISALILLFCVYVVLIPVTFLSAILINNCYKRDIFYLPYDLAETDSVSNVSRNASTFYYDGDIVVYLDKPIISELFYYDIASLSTLIIKNKHGETKKLKGISSPFVVAGDNIFYLDSSYAFCYKNIREEKGGKIESYMYNEFCEYNGDVYYIDINNNLVKYDVEAEEKTVIFADVGNFFIKDGSANILPSFSAYMVSISLDDTTDCNIRQFDLDGESIADARSFNGGYILWLMNGSIIIYPEKEESGHSYVIKSERGNTVSCICNDSKIIFSQKNYTVDGSIYYRTWEDLLSKENGTWEVDYNTGKKRKITDDTYEELFLYTDEILFGRNSKEIYVISVKTGKTVKITY